MHVCLSLPLPLLKHWQHAPRFSTYFWGTVVAVRELRKPFKRCHRFTGPDML